MNKSKCARCNEIKKLIEQDKQTMQDRDMLERYGNTKTKLYLLWDIVKLFKE